MRVTAGDRTAEVWTLLTPGGVVGSWRFPPGVRMLAAGDGVVLGVRTTELGTPIAVLYEFRPNR